MDDRLISIVIPSYNYKDYLPQAVASVAAQTYLNLELIIVDDASTDGSVALIGKLQEEHERRFPGGVNTLFHQANAGAHATINEGIAAAQGELVAILNADDRFEPERFSVMVKEMGSARFSFSAVHCIDEKGSPLRTEQAQAFEDIQVKIEGKRFMALAAVAENVCISSGNLLLEKALFTELGGFKNYKYVHDYDFFLRACLVAEPVFVKDTAYLYRLHGGNSFTKLAKVGLRENRMVWLDLYNEIRQGRVKNPVILENPYYRQEFYDAVCAEGKKKRILWKLSANPPARAVLRLLKRRYHIT